ncbi:MAG: VapB-like antitoxin [Saccharolobus sp.]|jgi:phosphopentomutase|uniref:VapB-like antitoxin n=1 Tax=Saccharolobus sp. TaxID=2100761 RepID=UPI0028CE788E|nr:VapB-like antitoxin [Saccharolobus sp.]MDT7862498.1 VapB-like antitoxin [Saccharolobus sp.]
MKLIVSYKINGYIYRIIINNDEPRVFEELDNILKTVCEKFNNDVKEYVVTRIKEEIPVGKITPIIAQASNSLADYKFSEDKNLDFIIKAMLNTSIGLVISNFIDSSAYKEEEVINAKNPCQNKDFQILQAVTEWQ